MKRTRVIFWGIFFILAAVAAVATQLSGNAMGLHWSQVIWALVLGMVVVESAAHLCLTGVFLPLGIAYNIFGDLIGLPSMATWVPIVAGLLLGIGLDILFSGVKRKYKRESDGQRGHCRQDNWEQARRIDEGNEENYPKVKLTFGSLHRYVNSEQLEGGDFSVSFGELKVDLTDAQPVAGAEIHCSCSFGEIGFIVPRHWKVEDNIRTAVGDIEHKGKRSEINADSPRIMLKGEVSFGNIEIMYV